LILFGNLSTFVYEMWVVWWLYYPTKLSLNIPAKII
jgi:hypothetical protein